MVFANPLLAYHYQRRPDEHESDDAVGGRLLELVFDDVIRDPEKEKPLDMLAEGLLVHSSRELSRPIGLFLAGMAAWEPHVARLVLAA